MNWEPNPAIHQIKQAKFLKESAVIISERNQLEIGIGGKNEYRYTRKIHKIVRVNDEKGIEMFNKIKISYSDDNPIIIKNPHYKSFWQSRGIEGKCF